MGEDWAWIGFVSGVIGIISFLFVSFKFINGPRESIDALSKKIAVLSLSIENEKIVRAARIEILLKTMEGTEAHCQMLVYQHKNPDNFEFGTTKTNAKIDELGRDLLKLRLVMENFLRT